MQAAGRSGVDAVARKMFGVAQLRFVLAQPRETRAGRGDCERQTLAQRAGCRSVLSYIGASFRRHALGALLPAFAA